MPWYRDKLAGIDGDALEDPTEWQKIPILDKDTLRKFSHAELLEAFCAVPRDQIAEYWRSGGSMASRSSIRARRTICATANCHGALVPLHRYRAR